MKSDKLRHTPGPWWSDGNKVLGPSLCAYGPYCRMCAPLVGEAHADHSLADEDADAALMAAAPDLLEAARLVAEAGIKSSEFLPDALRGPIVALRAAIARAMGAQ